MLSISKILEDNRIKIELAKYENTGEFAIGVWLFEGEITPSIASDLEETKEKSSREYIKQHEFKLSWLRKEIKALGIGHFKLEYVSHPKRNYKLTNIGTHIFPKQIQLINDKISWFELTTFDWYDKLITWLYANDIKIINDLEDNNESTTN